MSTQTIVLLEILAIGVIYEWRQGRWHLFKQAAAGQLVVTDK